MSASKLPDCPTCRTLAERALAEGKVGWCACSTCLVKQHEVSTEDEINVARDASHRASMAICQNRRGMAELVEITAQLTIIRRLLSRLLPGGEAELVETTAQLTIVRRLLSRLLPGGEAEFWRLVEEELRK